MAYAKGDIAVEINYQARVRILGPHPTLEGYYQIEGDGWDLPPWDDCACDDDLIPVVVRAKFDTREVW